MIRLVYAVYCRYHGLTDLCVLSAKDIMWYVPFGFCRLLKIAQHEMYRLVYAVYCKYHDMYRLVCAVF